MFAGLNNSTVSFKIKPLPKGGGLIFTIGSRRESVSAPPLRSEREGRNLILGGTTLHWKVLQFRYRVV